jgi:RNA polymerase sigma factor (sigma-70 family)
MTDSRTLLQEYARSGSEPAFRELVGRYVDLVYSTALRIVDGDTHLARDVSQMVFMDLSRMAGKVAGEVMLGGWLYQHTVYVASNLLRAERRRRARERTAMEMHAGEDHSRADFAQVAPLLDAAMSRLATEDRLAVLLRFFEQRDFKSVGEALGTSEDAARMRVNRALAKLHALLAARGVTLSVAALGAALVAGAIVRAPAGLAPSISGAVLGNAAASSAGGIAQTAISGKVQAFLALAGVILLGSGLLVLRRGQSRDTPAAEAPDRSVQAFVRTSEPVAPEAPASSGVGVLAAPGSLDVPAPEPGFAKPVLAPAATVSVAGVADPGNRPDGFLDLVWIRPGAFLMGSPSSEAGRGQNEGPRTRVILERGFWLSRCELTLAQFLAMGAAPLSGANDGEGDKPVLGVSWEQATNFCHLLNQREHAAGRVPEGYVYRLPTEAEWEYACRAGTSTRFSFGDDLAGTLIGSNAWYGANSAIGVRAGSAGDAAPAMRGARQVGTRAPNAWGLYDMHGNAAEWCLDWSGGYPGAAASNFTGVFRGTLHVLRGGDFLSAADACRSASRKVVESPNRLTTAGFRVALAPAAGEDIVAETNDESGRRENRDLTQTARESSLAEGGFDTTVSAGKNRDLVPLVLDLPAPAYKGKPATLQFGASVAPLSDQPRPDLLVPPDLTNLAARAWVTASDNNTTAAALAKITDGDKQAADESIVFLRRGGQWVQFDLGDPCEVFAIVLWHAHNSAKVFHDVVVEASPGTSFLKESRVLFNNDHDNSSGFGVGSDREYVETREGKLIDTKGMRIRLLRFFSRGSTESALNEYTEVEVYGRRLK